MGPIYEIIKPNIPTGQVYHFSTDFGVEYEVRFARKKENILHAVIAFGVLNEEYEGEEYALTNKGDVWKVMRTIITIISIYGEKHPNTQVYEFTGVLKEGEDNEMSQRTKLYLRYLPMIFDKTWLITIEGNKIVVSKKRK
ncbi:MAG: hypothetical protein IPO32_15865 [Crocinitomicaceae bacterium]|jgi:hypothetical protein|nr:hypothetical protein [Crocinitomicaceae bacterium]MBK6953528.1 hypothetical protein [Crocinitomicaceae bacterium]MBK9592901.1 hypothetical protein [Crocinitomicaceae bacterium]